MKFYPPLEDSIVHYYKPGCLNLLDTVCNWKISDESIAF